MIRLATFLWRTPAPTSIDEELALYDDGHARLVLRRPMRGGPSVGTYRATPDKAAFDELAAAGPGPIEFDLLHEPSSALAALMSRAREVSDSALEKPEAVATFYGRRQPGAGVGQVSLALGVVGAGDRPVAVDLNPASCAIHFSNDDQEVSWQEFPPVPMGFITPDAELLGGLNGSAEIAPGRWGTIVLDVNLPTSPYTAVALQVAGWLYGALPDELMPAPFDVRTDEIDLRLLA